MSDRINLKEQALRPAEDSIRVPRFESETLLNPREDCLYQHASFDNLPVEEQPAWLDELLNELESPSSHRSHRRAASDSAAYINGAVNPNSGLKIVSPGPLWVSHHIDHHHGIWQYNSSVDAAPSCGSRHGYQWGMPIKKGSRFPKPGMSSSVQKRGAVASKNLMKQGRDGRGGSSVRNEGQQANAAVKTDAKRAKQQNANRARERRLKYIAELEKILRMLQAEGSEVSSALGFFNQQNLMLSIENETLKERLDSLAQVQKLKQLEQDMLEREIGRLQFLYLQQQRQPHPQSPPQHSKLESQLATLAI